MAMASRMWGQVRGAFTAELLMTPREELFTWEVTNDLSEARTEAERRHFDMIPLTEEGHIVAVLLMEEASEPEPITDRWLISQDTSIDDLGPLFAESGRPGFLVLHRQDVVGLITPADLNKMPARVYFYYLIGEVEVALAARVEDHFEANESALLECFSEDRRETLPEQWSAMVEGNADVEIIQTLYLSDLVTAVAKTPNLRSALGFRSRKQTENALGGLVELRHRIMHLVRPLLEEVPEDLSALLDRAARANEVLGRAMN